MNKKLRFMWMLLLTFVCSTIWAEKYEYGNEKKYSKVPLLLPPTQVRPMC